MSPNSKSISKEIEKSIKQRIFLAFSALALLILFVSAYEIYKSIENLKNKLEKQSETVSHAIISEIMVDNLGSVQSRLNEIRDQYSLIDSVEWIKSGEVDSGGALRWEFPIGFVFRHPVQHESVGTFGHIKFHGNIAKDKYFLNPVILRLTLIAVFGMSVFFILMPLSRTIPNKFVRGPMAAIVRLFRDQKLDDVPKELLEYREIEPAVNDLRIYLEKKLQLEHEQAKNHRARAIADAMQMMAHDVRRPFSMLLAGLRQLEASEVPTELSAKFKRISAMTKDAAQSVERLMDGSMNLESQERAELSPEEPAGLIREALGEVFSGKSNVKIDFDYSFAHQHKALADRNKLRLVLANLIENAVEAQYGKGRIGFQTKETDSKIVFTIFNPGSFIEEGKRKKVFERFYTEGKRTGTGLGLAIVKKVVNDHGGDVSCSSTRSDGTGFSFSLPIAGSLTLGSINMPSNSSDLCVFTARGSDKNSENTGITTDLKILVIDDEEIYRHDVIAQLKLHNQSFRQAEFVEINVPDFDVAKYADVDLVLCDVDFKNKLQSGFDVAKKFKDAGFNGALVFVSNRLFHDVEKVTREQKVDAIFNKPLENADIDKITKLAIRGTPERLNYGKPKVAIIEDDELLVENWQLKMNDADIVHFENPEAFFSSVNGAGCNGYVAIVTDLKFKNSKLSGNDVAKCILKNGGSIPIVLSTGACKAEIVTHLYHYVCGKEGMSLAEIRSKTAY